MAAALKREGEGRPRSDAWRARARKGGRGGRTRRDAGGQGRARGERSCGGVHGRSRTAGAFASPRWVRASPRRHEREAQEARVARARARARGCDRATASLARGRRARRRRARRERRSMDAMWTDRGGARARAPRRRGTRADARRRARRRVARCRSRRLYPKRRLRRDRAPAARLRVLVTRSWLAWSVLVDAERRARGPQATPSRDPSRAHPGRALPRVETRWRRPPRSRTARRAATLIQRAARGAAARRDRARAGGRAPITCADARRRTRPGSIAGRASSKVNRTLEDFISTVGSKLWGARRGRPSTRAPRRDRDHDGPPGGAGGASGRARRGRARGASRRVNILQAETSFMGETSKRGTSTDTHTHTRRRPTRPTGAREAPWIEAPPIRSVVVTRRGPSTTPGSATRSEDPLGTS